jgi:trans-aconitate 2-methyltransferase
MHQPQHWDPQLYDGKHAFVWQHGASLVELLAPRPGERILDLGCGTGHLTAVLAEAGAVPVGLDHSAEMLAEARIKYPQLTFLQADARHFRVDEPCDAVFSNAALHWIKEPEAVLRCIHDALKLGGRFVAEFGGRGNVRTIASALETATEHLGLGPIQLPWYYPSVGDYAALAEAAGLEVRQAHLFDRPTPLQGASGLRDWVAMFARFALDRVPVGRRDLFLQTVEDLTRPTLFRDGTWVADYRRLRIVAVRFD